MHSPRRVAALVRHGHFPRPDNVASAHLPLPLSAMGREQAREGAERLIELVAAQCLTIEDTIEASSLLRASQTADILAETLGERLGRSFRVEERDELIERGLGSCANLRFDEIEALLAQDPRLAPLPRGWRRVPDFRLPVPGAESLMDAGRRTADRVDAGLDVIDSPDDRIRIFVAHSGCLRHAAVARAVLAPERAMVLSMDFVQAILVERDATGRWHHLAGEWPKHLPPTARPGERASRANLEPDSA